MDKIRKALTVQGLSYYRKNKTELDEDYLATRLQGIGWKPLNTKSAPTAIGWSDVTLTLNETFVTGSVVSGVLNGTARVFPAPIAPVLAPAHPREAPAGLQ